MLLNLYLKGTAGGVAGHDGLRVLGIRLNDRMAAEICHLMRIHRLRSSRLAVAARRTRRRRQAIAAVAAAAAHATGCWAGRRRDRLRRPRLAAQVRAGRLRRSRIAVLRARRHGLLLAVGIIDKDLERFLIGSRVILLAGGGQLGLVGGGGQVLLRVMLAVAAMAGKVQGLAGRLGG